MIKKIVKNISLLLISIVLFLAIEIEHIGAVGDVILIKLGFNTYSNGGTGYHLIFFYSLILIGIIVIVTIKYTKIRYTFMHIILFLAVTSFVFSRITIFTVE